VLFRSERRRAHDDRGTSGNFGSTKLPVHSAVTRPVALTSIARVDKACCRGPVSILGSVELTRQFFSCPPMLSGGSCGTTLERLLAAAPVPVNRLTGTQEKSNRIRTAKRKTEVLMEGLTFIIATSPN
jgi:hypothetical protein